MATKVSKSKSRPAVRSKVNIAQKHITRRIGTNQRVEQRAKRRFRLPDVLPRAHDAVFKYDAPEVSIEMI